MKTVVFLLVLANLLFYAFTAGYFGQPASPDAGRLEQQVAPEKMRLVSHGEAPASKPAAKPPADVVAEVPPVMPATNGEAAAAEKVPAEKGGSEKTPAEKAAPEKPAVAAANEKLCLRWEHLAQADANQLVTRLGDKVRGVRVVKKAEPGEGNGWWVYIPPLAGKDEADKKAGELRQLGVTDYFIVQEAGPNRHAISLGLFSSEKGGQERLAELKARGVRSARLNIRPGKDSLMTVEVAGAQAEREAILAAARPVVGKTAAQDCK